MPFWILHLLITNRTISLMVVRKQFICSGLVYMCTSHCHELYTALRPRRPSDLGTDPPKPGAKVRILNKLYNFLYTLGATLKRNIFRVYCQ